MTQVKSLHFPLSKKSPHATSILKSINVMIDIRFSCYFSAVYTFEERFRLADEGWNKDWNKGCYGDKWLDDLLAKDMQVICVGVTIGLSHNAMLAYFDAFAKELAHHCDKATVCWTSVFGSDTAVHYKVMLDLLGKRGHREGHCKVC